MEGSSPINDVWGEYCKAQAGYNEENYQSSADQCIKVKTTCETLLKKKKNSYEQSEYQGIMHLAEATRNECLYEMERKTGNDPSKKTSALVGALNEAKLAKDVFINIDSKEVAYSKLVGVYYNYYGLLTSLLDYFTAFSLTQQMEQNLNEFYRIAQSEKFKKYLPDLYHIRYNKNIAEAVLFTWQMNYVASSNSFKLAKQLLEDAKKENVEIPKISQTSGEGSMLDAVSEFVEGNNLQTRGEYKEAMEHLKLAESKFANAQDSMSKILGMFASGHYHFVFATEQELNGFNNTAIEEYGKAEAIFRNAYDSMPSDIPSCSVVAGQIQALADAAKNRQKAARIRAASIREKTQKARRMAGLLFFGLWIACILTITLAIKIIPLNVDSLTFFGYAFVAFIIAAVAALLLKPKEGLDAFRELIGVLKGSGKGTNQSTE